MSAITWDKALDRILEEELGHMRPHGNDYPDEAGYMDAAGDFEEWLSRLKNSISNEVIGNIDITPNQQIELKRLIDGE